MLVGLFCLPFAVHAADPDAVQRGLLAGNYAAVIKQATGELREAPGNAEWTLLLVRAYLETGRYADADRAIALWSALTDSARTLGAGTCHFRQR